LYTSHFVKENSAQKIYYKRYANKLTKIKFIAKQNYYQKELIKSKNNAFKMQKVIKSLHF